MSTLRRRLLAVGLAAMLVTIGGAVPLAAGATSHDPVLLVHGWRGDPSTWAEDMIPWLTAAGRDTVHAIDLASEDNVKNAAQIDAYIKGQGWGRVDIIAQSMGGLSSRHYIKFRTSSAVDAYVSLGTPQYGVWSACALPQSSGGQMCPTSRFLKDLNRGDDTPGSVSWTTIYSTDDGVVPTSSSRLDGGACHVQVSGVPHNDMDNDPGIFDHVLAAIDRQPCTGTFVN